MLDGYKCSKCQEQNCSKTDTITQIAPSLVFTLTRFVLDMYTCEYMKDNALLEMPSVIDIEGFLSVRESELTD